MSWLISLIIITQSNCLSNLSYLGGCSRRVWCLGVCAHVLLLCCDLLAITKLSPLISTFSWFTWRWLKRWFGETSWENFSSAPSSRAKALWRKPTLRSDTQGARGSTHGSLCLQLISPSHCRMMSSHPLTS